MPNPYKRCDVCHFNHRPGRCKKSPEEDALQRIGVVRPGSPVPVDLKHIPSTSRVTFVVDLEPLLAVLGRIEGKLDRMSGAKQEIRVGGEGR